VASGQRPIMVSGVYQFTTTTSSTVVTAAARWFTSSSVASPGAAFSKVPRKILGKFLILGATDTQVATSSRGYSATVEHCTNRPVNSIQRGNRILCSSSSSNSSSKIRSFPKIFLGTFENAVPELLMRALRCILCVCVVGGGYVMSATSKRARC